MNNLGLLGRGSMWRRPIKVGKDKPERGTTLKEIGLYVNT